ncbi:GNAT family N-acetyltransferase [Ruegeria sp. ANG-S4]|uniref:GNAT family N-acetyltransferase n=1 Tax=Ruegeria sp. ANG-S4 TaxID=1577904 RepID=UPI000689BCE1|nr:GNAT family N-acetyltransferase [Ruegeria sp. ANG-S4]
MLDTNIEALPHQVRVADVSEREQVLNAITLGFSADPVARWIWPEARTYLNAMPRFAAAFGGRAIDAGTAFVTDGLRAASLWLQPGIEPDGDTIEGILEETVRPEISDDLNKMFELMDAHHPEETHWYLPMIAADPRFLGLGHGAAILKHALRTCDETETLVYLESSNARNISLYERFGFETIGEIAPGEAPPMYPMIRQPRSV